jgi:hypothetical protein
MIITFNRAHEIANEIDNKARQQTPAERLEFTRAFAVSIAIAHGSTIVLRLDIRRFRCRTHDCRRPFRVSWLRNLRK